MSSISLLVVAHDPHALTQLASTLGQQFSTVLLAHSLNQANAVIHQQMPDVVVADLETLDTEELCSLTRQLHLPVICTHRIPDEQMWTAALEAGALDVCCGSDPASLLSAVHRHLSDLRRAA